MNNIIATISDSRIVTLAVIVGIAALLWLVTLVARHRLSLAAGNARRRLVSVVFDLVRHTRWWLMLFVALYAVTVYIELPDRIDSIARYVVVIAVAIQAGIWGTALLTSAIERYQRRQMKEDPGSVTALNAVGFVGKLVLWSAITLVALDNLGFNITTLVAGLGVGGVAVALAVQNILGDLFASLSIVIDRPFEVGDFLVIDDYMGTVEQVGLKTTRIRSLSGEQLVFSNSDLLKSRIRNYGLMYERRVVQQIGVTYQTPRDKLKKIPRLFREAVEEQEHTRFDRSHFMRYGDSSLVFETVYYVLDADYNIYMDIQQAINYRIHERFEQEGIEFAYPTQTLLLRNER